MNRNFREELKRREEWARKLVPRRAPKKTPRPMASADQMLRTFVQWSDAYDDKPPSFLHLIRLIRSISTYDLVEVLARINLVYYHNQTEGKVTPIPAEFFPSGVAERIVKKHQGNPTVFVPRSSLLYLQMLVLRFGNNKERSLPTEHLHTLGKILLGAANFSEGPETGKIALSGEAIKGYLYSNFLLNRTKDLAAVIGRYWHFITHYSVALRPHFDVGGKISKAIGHPSDLEAALVFGLISYYLSKSPREYEKDPRAFLTPFSYFDSTTTPEISSNGRDLLNTLSRTQAQFASYLQNQNHPKSAYDCRSIFDTPYFRINEVVLPLDISFLAEQASIGLYFRAYTAMRKTGTHAQLAEAWGRVFEHHIKQLLEHEMPGMLGKRLFCESLHGFENCDFIIRDGQTLVFLEATIASVPPLRSLSGDWAQIKESIDTILFEREQGAPGKAFQMASAVERFKKGELKLPGVDPQLIKRIIPVLVTEHGIPQIPTIVDALREEIHQKTKMTEASSFEFWDIDELELASSLFKDSISEVIDRKHAGQYLNFPMKNFISAAVPSLRRSTYLTKLWETAANDIEKALFSKPS